MISILSNQLTIAYQSAALARFPLIPCHTRSVLHNYIHSIFPVPPIPTAWRIATNATFQPVIVKVRTHGLANSNSYTHNSITSKPQSRLLDPRDALRIVHQFKSMRMFFPRNINLNLVYLISSPYLPVWFLHHQPACLELTKAFDSVDNNIIRQTEKRFVLRDLADLMQGQLACIMQSCVCIVHSPMCTHPLCAQWSRRKLLR